jgi:hypothetical protein
MDDQGKRATAAIEWLSELPTLLADDGWWIVEFDCSDDGMELGAIYRCTKKYEPMDGEFKGATLLGAIEAARAGYKQPVPQPKQTSFC